MEREKKKERETASLGGKNESGEKVRSKNESVGNTGVRAESKPKGKEVEGESEKKWRVKKSFYLGDGEVRRAYKASKLMLLLVYKDTPPFLYLLTLTVRFMFLFLLFCRNLETYSQRTSQMGFHPFEG